MVKHPVITFGDPKLSRGDRALLTDLRSLNQRRDAYRALALKDVRYGFDKPWPLFFELMRLLPSQSYGARLERYLRHFYGWERVLPSAGSGDAVDNGTHVEIKVSVLGASSPKVHWVQLRPGHGVDYRLFVIEPDSTVHRFDVTHDQMIAELARRSDAAHGSKSGRFDEYAIRFMWDSDEQVHWVTHYLSTSSVPGVESAT